MTEMATNWMNMLTLIDEPDDPRPAEVDVAPLSAALGGPVHDFSRPTPERLAATRRREEIAEVLAVIRQRKRGR